MRKRIAIGDNFRFDHFTQQVVPFACTLAYSGENRETLAAFRNVVDQLHDQNRLANARTAEQPDLSTTKKWLNKIDDLDAGLEHFKFRRLLIESGSMAMDRVTRIGHKLAQFINRIPDYVHYPSQCWAPDRDRDRASEIRHFHSSDHSLGR